MLAMFHQPNRPNPGEDDDGAHIRYAWMNNAQSMHASLSKNPAVGLGCAGRFAAKQAQRLMYVADAIAIFMLVFLQSCARCGKALSESEHV